MSCLQDRMRQKAIRYVSRTVETVRRVASRQGSDKITLPADNPLLYSRTWPRSGKNFRRAKSAVSASLATFPRQLFFCPPFFAVLHCLGGMSQLAKHLERRSPREERVLSGL
jgi:hypothetical protein